MAKERGNTFSDRRIRGKAERQAPPQGLEARREITVRIVDIKGRKSSSRQDRERKRKRPRNQSLNRG